MLIELKQVLSSDLRGALLPFIFSLLCAGLLLRCCKVFLVVTVCGGRRWCSQWCCPAAKPLRSTRNGCGVLVAACGCGAAGFGGALKFPFFLPSCVGGPAPD